MNTPLGIKLRVAARQLRTDILAGGYAGAGPGAECELRGLVMFLDLCADEADDLARQPSQRELEAAGVAIFRPRNSLTTQPTGGAA